ncbi:MAG: MiaB/RimO family radical SAM methylthiotransferase [Lachnospiraceae bacterium]|nr:MiaB/RimO family radical SAM methylthiotransferase [Lachnospiraceae bacterium]
MKKVAFHNLGCKVNSYEMEVMRQIVQNNGYEIVQFTQKADVYIVNTCTVTNIADRKSRQMLHRAKQLNPVAVVVAVGCYAQTGADMLKDDDAVDIIVGNNHKTEIADILDKYFKDHPEIKDIDNGDFSILNEDKMCVMSDLTGPSDYENAIITEGESRTRADVKIQDGCNQFCSYCAIPLARGRVRSRRPEDVIEEIKTLALNGHKEIVLTGIHICSYGIDFDDEAWKKGEVKPSTHEIFDRDGDDDSSNKMMKDYRGKTKLFELVEMIDSRIPKDMITRIRLGSLEPRVITPENVAILVKTERVCPHFHLSLQSGCDETLKRMNRHYTTSEFNAGAELLRNEYKKAGKSVAITTDVIVGFPGETEEEFGKTKEFLEDIKLYEMHIFKYSRRKGTVADRLPGQIPEQVKGVRSDALLEMTERHSWEYREQYLGKKQSVLFEEKKDGFWYGHTNDYVKIGVRENEENKNVLKTGALIDVIVQKRGDKDELIGEIFK